MGSIGAILAVPLTLVISTVLERFEVTRGLVKLARPPFASDTTEDEEDRRQAQEQLGEWIQRGRPVFQTESDKKVDTTSEA